MSRNASGNLSLLASKHVGTGGADTKSHSFLVNQHRDTLASIVGRHDHLSYVAVGEGKSLGRVKSEALEGMLFPCGEEVRD
ncbi:hypothetical protein TrRE_jg10231 [Triparma retinervis]|uniref:Uncharacterized protein n=1 Tax=Triparma retinervis TaxID=2557542 RepID=A0A9W6ZNK9_9STRA|nr:hypothetical protein TrRE_jg10231 [Triparma retinervis]